MLNQELGQKKKNVSETSEDWTNAHDQNLNITNQQILIYIFYVIFTFCDAN